MALLRMTKTWMLFAVSGVFLAGCASRSVDTLDVRPRDMAQINTIAIATVAAQPGLSLPMFGGKQGELVGALTKFETEMTYALLNRGFNVVPPSQSRVVYAHGTDYEEAYVRNNPSILTNLRSDQDVKWFAERLKEQTKTVSMKPSASLTSGMRESAAKYLTPQMDETPMFMAYGTDSLVTSANTRLFGEADENAFSLPRTTHKGGALDERFTSNALRVAVGDLTRQMGADAYLLVDANLLLSSTKEGMFLAGLSGGGTRYATYDGTAQLVRADGKILATDRFRIQSPQPVTGDGKTAYTSERGSGILGVYRHYDEQTLQEGAYQALRTAALDLANRYDAYRKDGFRQAEKEQRDQQKALEKAAASPAPSHTK